MEENLEELCQRLSLSEQQQEEILVDTTLLESHKNRGEKCLIMSLLTDKNYNREAFKQIMRKIWHPMKKVSFKDLGSRLILVEFEYCIEKDRVKRERPWSFDKHLVLLKDFEGEFLINNITITKAAFWIRLYDLPLYAMNEHVARLIGDSIGSVEEIDVKKGEVAWGEFIRVTVRLNITKPLMRGKRINLGPHGSCWVRFVYDRLPNFCYVCGRLGHNHRDCSCW